MAAALLHMPPQNVLGVAKDAPTKAAPLTLQSLRKIFLDLDLKFDKRYLNAYFARTEMGKMSKMSEI